jgi:hypothetical protein
VLGPHFEQLCRHWTRYFAPQEITGGFPARVAPGTVNDPASRKTRQVDVAAFGFEGSDRQTLLAIGEVKWHETMGLAHLERLRQIRGLLAGQGRHGAAGARLLCFSGAGFTAELVDEAARSGDLRLVTPADLYMGVVGLPLRADRQGRAMASRSPTAATVSGRCSVMPVRPSVSWRAARGGALRRRAPAGLAGDVEFAAGHAQRIAGAFAKLPDRRSVLSGRRIQLLLTLRRWGHHLALNHAFAEVVNAAVASVPARSGMIPIRGTRCLLR